MTKLTAMLDEMFNLTLGCYIQETPKYQAPTAKRVSRCDFRESRRMRESWISGPQSVAV